MSDNRHDGKTTPSQENRLSRETSPYLLQHKYNPVDWYPWGEEAFERARRENKPLLISIGYSACHWCHVMERECFEDPDIARLINETVIPVKVDREERPDVDAIYMNACVAMTGQGGWPLNAFVTPDLKPFFVGTYFPPDSRWGRPGFPQVLLRIREAWLTDRDQIVAQAEHLHRELERYGRIQRRATVEPGVMTRLIEQSASQFDAGHGGFGGAPKFPPDQRLAALLAAAHDLQSETALRMLTKTLDSMAYGGIYDQIGGGFSRYSVDAEWLIPHFEKMLYNQALLVPVYLDAYLVTGKDLYRRIATETMDWVLRDLTSPDGAFYCALDADSEGEEGKYYTWTPEQVEAVLGAADASLFCAQFGITKQGNFEHATTVLHVTQEPEVFAAAHGMKPSEWLDRLAGMKSRLLAARGRRVPPGLDDKCLTGWNGLMISALARGYQVTGERRYLTAAVRAAGFLLEKQVQDDGRILRVHCRGESKIAGVLEDYAYFAASLLDLYETCFDTAYLRHARMMADRLVAEFYDPETDTFFSAPAGDPSLVSRSRELHDGALPAAGSVAVLTLLRLAAFDGETRHAGLLEKYFQAAAPGLNSAPHAFSSLVLAHRFATGPTPQVVLVAPDDSGPCPAMLETVWRTYVPARLLAVKTADSQGPLFDGKTPLKGAPTVYVCFNMSCKPPTTSAAELARQLKATRSEAASN
jgi:uncharacterized protein YyaL (SSP411 family)